MTRTSLPRPQKIEGHGPTLSTLHDIERILREADRPLSLNEVRRRMSAKAIRHSIVREAIDEFKRRGFVIEGKKGIVWGLNLSPDIWAGKWREL